MLLALALTCFVGAHVGIRVCVAVGLGIAVVVVFGVSSRTNCSNLLMRVGNDHGMAEGASSHLLLGACRACELSFKEE